MHVSFDAQIPCFRENGSVSKPKYGKSLYKFQGFIDFCCLPLQVKLFKPAPGSGSVGKYKTLHIPKKKKTVPVHQSGSDSYMCWV